MREKTVTISGLRTRYLETETVRKAPLVLLHGWGSSITSWRRVAEVLESANVKVFIPDLPGFGDTPQPPRPWHLNDYIVFVHEFVKTLGIKTFCLAGHSFGGQISIGYATQYPKKIRKLILIAAARIVRRRKLKVAIFGFFSKLGNLAFSMPFLSFLRPVFQKTWYKLSGEQDYYRASNVMRETMKLILDREMRDELIKIRVPTLIIWGEKDLVTPLADAKILHGEIQGSRLHVFPQQNHDLNKKVPEKLAAEISNWVTR